VADPDRHARKLFAHNDLCGPREPWPFRRKLAIAGIAAVAYGVLILGALLVLCAEGSFLALMINAVFFPLVLIVVSAWGLAISHVIDNAHHKLEMVSAKEVTAMWTGERG